MSGNNPGDRHPHDVFQAAVLDLESGEVVQERFSADRASVVATPSGGGPVAAVAIEATTGWRWVWRELVGQGFDVRVAEPVRHLHGAGEAGASEPEDPAADRPASRSESAPSPSRGV